MTVKSEVEVFSFGLTILSDHYELNMDRLNSGIFRIFKVSVQNLNLNSSDCRALKIITNDTKLEPISWELNLKNPLFKRAFK